MRPSLAVFLIFALAGSAGAQIPLDRERDQAVGISLGVASGAGIAYTEVLPSAFGYRAALALWKYGDFTFVDFGVAGLRILSDDGRRRLYLIAGASYWRRSNEEVEPILDDDDNVVGERVFDDVDDSMAIGAGAGMELPFGVRTAITLEALFTYWTDSGDLLPVPQVGLHYLF